MVLWFLAEGLDQAVLIRFTGHSETTIARWLQRADSHSHNWHHRLLRQLVPVVCKRSKKSRPGFFATLEAKAKEQDGCKVERYKPQLSTQECFGSAV